jgi:ABC-type transport system involved in multi-copper enzyme maturation permease subunit
MNLIFLIARDSFKALLHQRLLVGLMLVAFGMTVFFSAIMSRTRDSITAQFDFSSTETNSPVFGKMNEQDKKKMNEAMEQGATAIQGFFYAASSFGGSIVALMIFSTAVTAEIRRGTIRLTLSKPVSRLQYLAGKYLGGLAVMVIYALLTSAAVLIFSASTKVQLSPVLSYAPWLMFCRQLMLGSVALLLSLFLHPAVAAVLAFFAGNGLFSTSNPLYYLLPSYAPFNVFTAILQGSMMSRTDVVLLTLYALDFVVLMLLLALWRFQKREVCS